MKSSLNRPETAPRVVLVADGGAPPGPAPTRDPFEALDDLLAVVEALCPTWPPQEVPRRMPAARL